MRNLSLKQLQAVASIARCGTITGAARELHVTPAALTARLKQLEDEVGLLLFDRTSSGLRVTDAGREVLWAIDSITVVLDACAEKLQGLKGVGAGRVSVAVVSTAKYFAPSIISGFVREHPGVEISLKVGNRNDTIEALRGYAVDLAIMGRPPRDFPIEAEAFGEHPLVVIAPPNHRLVGRRGLTREDLADEAFLVREYGSGTRTVFEEFMTGLVIKRARLGIEAGSNETIKQAVMAGLGVALISGHTVASEVEDGRIAILDVEGLPIRREWFAVRRSEKVLGPAATSFWAYVVEQGRSWLPDVRGQARPRRVRGEGVG
jgi:DNA-binding transcriptional LysR family regulator